MNLENLRIVKLDGCSNFRDIGGRSAENGQKLKTGLIYRSEELSRLSKKDWQILDKLGIKLIIDIRTKDEIRKRPDRISPKSGAKYISIPIKPTNGNISHISVFKSFLAKETGISFDDFLKDHYKTIAFDRYGEMNKIFSLLSNMDNLPAVIHCSIGKDRTGFISALIQLLAGVPRERIMEDYLASNELVEKRMNEILLFLRIISLFRVSKAKIRPLFEARTEYIAPAFDELFAKYGTVENYLITACGIAPDRVASLKNILTF